jgi:hypothetical protein
MWLAPCILSLHHLPWPFQSLLKSVTNVYSAYSTSSQKPGDELYANFREHFPAITSTPTTSGSTNAGSDSVDAVANAPGQEV